MKISILHPSRSRPTQAAATAKAWLSSAKDRGNVEYILSLDSDDPTYTQVYHDFKNTPNVLFNVRYHKSAIDAINAAASISIGDIILVTSDDFSTPPFHWDAALLEALEGKEDFLVKTQDGIQRTLVTLPIMDRKYYERFGYIYHPDYLHMESDVELTSVANMLGRIIELPIMIRHNHYTQKGGQPKDAVNIKNDKTYPQGKEVITRRRKINFDIPKELIVKPYSAIQW